MRPTKLSHGPGSGKDVGKRNLSPFPGETTAKGANSLSNSTECCCGQGSLNLMQSPPGRGRVVGHKHNITIDITTTLSP